MPNEMKWNGAQVKADIESAIDRALRLSAITIRGRAVLLVPVDTGVLRSSVTYVISGDAQAFPDAAQDTGSLITGRTIKAEPGTAIIGTVVFYAPYVEMGTRYQKAQAFLLPAYRDSFDDIRSFFAAQVGGVEWLS